ncbi:hypothetical protein TNIN_397541 [Trichonephila inaurata madagascariensis]|uniref:Uncharacterized protein n=1 Tax=Trichonephila inaurata madagascariensis TaxID=2747483 RepID=A0A8X6M9V6_9ARAC|nr:hypothetical protein TNIN_397541 [Trichonephila inaurata madagascariensis]
MSFGLYFSSRLVMCKIHTQYGSKSKYEAENSAYSEMSRQDEQKDQLGSGMFSKDKENGRSMTSVTLEFEIAHSIINEFGDHRSFQITGTTARGISWDCSRSSKAMIDWYTYKQKVSND